MDDFDDGLRRGEAVHHVLADGLLLDRCHELAHHFERDVGLEQSHAHFTQGQLDVFFAEAALAAEAVEDGLELL